MPVTSAEKEGRVSRGGREGQQLDSTALVVDHVEARLDVPEMPFAVHLKKQPLLPALGAQHEVLFEAAEAALDVHVVSLLP